MECPEDGCREETAWIRIEEDPDGGWYQCRDQHQYRSTPSGWVPMT